MTRIALVIDSDPVCRYVGELLDAIVAADVSQSGSLALSSLVVPADGKGGEYPAGRFAWAAAFADRLVGFELSCMRLVKRLRPALGRRIGFREAVPRDIRPLFAQVIEFAPGDQASFDAPPGIVLVLGHWLPPAVLARCPPAATVLQVELGARPAQGLALAGFEECWSAADCTPVRLYRVSPADGSRECLVDGCNRTKRLLSLNQAAIWDRTLSLLLSQLLTGAVRDACPAAEPGGASDVAGTSLAWELASYPLRLLGRGARLAAQQLRGQRRWSVAIYRQTAAGQPLSTPAEVDAAPAGAYQADPILYRDPGSGNAYCFVEEVGKSTKRGHIAVLEESGGRWRRRGIALKEPFHLSFPYLFRFDGKVYMCPETGASREIRVYRSTDFPLGWELDAVLMRGISATDTMLVPHDGRWWMLTNIDRARQPDHQSELHVFHADSPLSTKWQAAGGNPVKVDCRGGRNGGLQIVDGRIYRFGQVQSFDAYGYGLNRYEITRLAANGYDESFREAIAPPPGSGASGIHTYTSIDGWVAVDLLGANDASVRKAHR